MANPTDHVGLGSISPNGDFEERSAFTPTAEVGAIFEYRRFVPLTAVSNCSKSRINSERLHDYHVHPCRRQALLRDWAISRLMIGHAYRGLLLCRRRQAAGGVPTSFLKARLKAASDP